MLLNDMIFPKTLAYVFHQGPGRTKEKYISYFVICTQYTNHEQNMPVRTHLLMSYISKIYSMNFYVI
jgi:hypothetical protein